MIIDTIILATQNQGKVTEMKRRLADLPVKIVAASVSPVELPSK